MLEYCYILEFIGRGFKKYSTHADMIEGSFIEYLNQVVEKYNLNNLKSVQ